MEPLGAERLSTPPERPRAERVLALARVFFAASSLVAVALDPTQLGHSSFGYALLTMYLGARSNARGLRAKLHDGIIQSLIGLEMQVEALRRSPRDVAQVIEGLAKIQQHLASEIRDVRD